MARIDTLEEAQVAARAIKSGSLDPAQQEELLAAVRDFSSKQTARDEFVSTKLAATPQEPRVPLDVVMPKGFASDEDREEFVRTNPAVKAARAAAKGVNVKDGIDPAIRAKAGLLNFNPVTATYVLDELVRQSLPEGEVPDGIPAVASVEGVPSALVRQEDGTYRYHAIDPVGIDTGDLAEFAGELPQIGAEIVGGIAGAAAGGATGSIPGAIVGGAAGAGAGAVMSLDARVWLAKRLGVPEEMVDGAVTSDIRFREALLAAGGDVLTAGVLGSARALSNKFGGRMLEPEDVERLMPDVEESLRMAGEFKDRTGKELPMTLGQLTGDTDIIQAERALKSQARASTSAQLAKDEAVRDRAINDALRDVTEQRVRTPRDNIRSIEEVTEDVTAGTRGAAAEARRNVETAQENLDTFAESMDEALSPDVFVKVRENAFEAADAARAAETKAWDQWRKEVEWKQGEGSNIRFHSPANSPIKNLLLELDEDAQRALLESTQKAQQKFVQDAGLPEEGATKGLAGEWLDPRELHFTLSDLKRRVRQAEKSSDPDGFRVGDMKRMIGAIQETIETAPMARASSGRTVRPEKAARVRDAFQVANETTLRTHSLFDSANMRALLEVNPRTGKMQMPSGTIYKRMFQENDPRFLNEALEAVGQNPQIKGRLADELLKKHRNATKSDFTGDAHRRFMDEHHDHIRALGINPDQLRGAGTLARAVRVAQANAKRVGERLARTFGKRLSDETTDVINIHEELFKLPAAKANNVMRFLDEADTALANEVRDHSLVSIRRDLASKGDTTINFEQLWKYVDERPEVLKALHGEEYLNDLRMFKKLQQLVERDKLGRTPTGQNTQAWWLDVTRSLFGPLSKKQRFISAVQRNNRRLMASKARTVISSPDDLHQLVKMRLRSPQEVIQQGLLSDAIAAIIPENNELYYEGAAALGRLPSGRADDYRRRMGSPTAQRSAAAGSTIVPGRGSPAEAVGGRRPARSESPEADGPAVSLLRQHEGFSPTPYIDTTGHRTIGFGRNLEANPITPEEYRAMGTDAETVRREGLTEEQATVLLRNDYKRAVAQAVKLPGFSELDTARREVLVNMVFNMGPAGVRKFKDMFKAIKAEDYAGAAKAMLDSLWARQVGRRATELANIMKTGRFPE